jgi:hypothetical protein
VEVFILEGWAVTGPGGRGINTEVREPGAQLMGCRLRGVSQNAVNDSVVGEIVTTGARRQAQRLARSTDGDRAVLPARRVHGDEGGDGRGGGQCR